MAYKNIKVEKKDSIGVIKINRPEALNALNKDTLIELSKAVDELEKDKQIKIPPESFCYKNSLVSSCLSFVYLG